MSPDALMAARIDEARRQIEICNACRYCEGYCAVFPAMTRQKIFADADITHLANLCHNCRGCYYACQYTPPHEFDLNLPAALAEVRQDSWTRYAGPQRFARAFHEHGGAIAAALVAGIGLLILAINALRPEGGEGFYAVLSHTAMVAIFTPAFLLPLVLVALALRSYWRETGGGKPSLSGFAAALRNAARLKNLDGGQGQGCNFEQEDRYTDIRRVLHQLAMYGFLLCFASTTVATIMHYALSMPAPYGLFSLPKLLGVPGGILLVVGTAGLAVLKLKADPALGDRRIWGGEMAFTLLLGLTGLTGLLLYVLGGTAMLVPLLALHLGSVLALFLLLPYSKMVHGFFRIAALWSEAEKRGVPGSRQGGD